MILPPSDIRVIIEKLAAYVVKNGKSFEDKILEKERHNARFSFLFPHDPYHPYYEKRLEEYTSVGPDGVDEMLARSKVMEQSRVDSSVTGISIAKATTLQKEIPKEGERLEFLTELPPVSSLDYEVIKLTAQYVARNGRQFMLSLTQREARNAQFEFLKPSHSLYPLFMRLVDQYTRILIPSKSLLSRLDLCANDKFTLLQRIIERTEYDRYIKDQQLKEDEIAERERLAFASIDWHDFVICETVDFGANDLRMELPKPLEFKEIISMTLVQRKDLYKGSTTSTTTNNKLDQGDEAMDVDDGSPLNFTVSAAAVVPPEAKRPSFQVAEPFRNPSIPHLRVRQDYIPKAVQQEQQQNNSTLDTSTCPYCKQEFLKSEISEHMRIEALDPKWREQREKHLAKHQETNYVTSGVDVTGHLGEMNRIRTTMSSMTAEEGARMMSNANRVAASQTTIWDGRLQGDSLGQVNREASMRARLQAEAELKAMQQQQPK